jgi:hypothetical protein
LPAAENPASGKHQERNKMQLKTKGDARKMF